MLHYVLEVGPKEDQKEAQMEGGKCAQKDTPKRGREMTQKGYLPKQPILAFCLKWLINVLINNTE